LGEVLMVLCTSMMYAKLC